MALSNNAVQKAYEVLNELKRSVHPNLSIKSWPLDLQELEKDERRKTIEPDTLYGYDNKSDGGWENLIFWTNDPSCELKEEFDKLKSRVPNSSISKYDEFMGMWMFGWF